MVLRLRNKKLYVLLPAVMLGLSMLTYSLLSCHGDWLQPADMVEEVTQCVFGRPCLYVPSVDLRVIVIAFNRPASLQVGSLLRQPT